MVYIACRTKLTSLRWWCYRVKARNIIRTVYLIGMVKMILFRKFRVLILMVFLVACTMHIMIDLLPKLEKRAAGTNSGTGGCSCSHNPSEEPRNWAKQQARSGPESGWPNKHTLRILQDFSNEPSSNLTSHSLEKVTGTAEKADSVKRMRQVPGNAENQRPLIKDSVAGKKAYASGFSRLTALYDHPLYKFDLPALTDDDTLFSVNTDIRLYPKAAGNPEW